MFETLHEVGVVGHLSADGLEGDDLLELPIPGFVDLAHAAFAEKFQDLIAIAERDVGG